MVLYGIHLVLTSNGIDCKKIFEPIVEAETAYMPLEFAAEYNLEVECINERYSFMYTDAREEVIIPVLALHSFKFWPFFLPVSLQETCRKRHGTARAPFPTFIQGLHSFGVWRYCFPFSSQKT
jgi:hypothetical protein